MLEDALRFTYEKLTKEELVNLAIMLTVDGLHSAGRKKIDYKPYIKKNEYDSTTDLIFHTRIEAEKAFAAIHDIFEEFGRVTKADVLEICGKALCYTDSFTGWGSLDGMRILRVTDGWQIVMPRKSWTKLKNLEQERVVEF